MNPESSIKNFEAMVENYRQQVDRHLFMRRLRARLSQLPHILSLNLSAGAFEHEMAEAFAELWDACPRAGIRRKELAAFARAGWDHWVARNEQCNDKEFIGGA